MKSNKEKKSGKILNGKITSTSMNKVVVVDIENSKTHKIYKKSFKVNKKIKACNNLDNINIGDMVYVSEIRPKSKDTHFKVIKVEKK